MAANPNLDGLITSLEETDIEDFAELWEVLSDSERRELAELTSRLPRFFPNPGPQTWLIECDADEIFFGGARGGGKSFGLLLDWLNHERKWGGRANGICVRRTLVELEELVEIAKEVLTAAGAVFKAWNRTFIFPSGARLKFRYLAKDCDADNYLGHAYTWIAIEEAGSFPFRSPIDRMRSTLRSAHGVKVRMLLTGNPGGVGHSWLKNRFIDPAAPGQEMVEVLKNSKGKEFTWRRMYIPSRVEDNPMLPESYEAQLALSGPDWLVRAWMSGDWNIVAGGRFDHLFTPENLRRIVVPWFPIPSGWRIDRSFDWGKSKPFSVGWWAESDGTPARMTNGRLIYLPRGSVVRIGEWYGCKKDKPNEGLQMSSEDVARGILARDRHFGTKVYPGPADASIFSSQDGKSIADKMKEVGCHWDSSRHCVEGGRINGWEIMETMLTEAAKPESDRPGLYIMETCRHFLRTVPMLPRDQTKIDDVDTNSEDHIADETRYRVTMKRYTLTVTKGVFNAS